MLIILVIIIIITIIIIIIYIYIIIIIINIIIVCMPNAPTIPARLFASHPRALGSGVRTQSMRYYQ